MCTRSYSSSGQCGNWIVRLLLYADVPHRPSQHLQDGKVHVYLLRNIAAVHDQSSILMAHSTEVGHWPSGHNARKKLPLRPFHT